MAWGFLDDKAHSHPKFAQAGKAATGVWWQSVSWARDHRERRGVIPEATARWTLRADDADIEALIGAVLWERVDDGYLIHGYRERYEREDAKRAEHARKAAGGRWGKARGDRDAPSMPDACDENARPMLGHARSMPRARATDTDTDTESPNGLLSPAPPDDVPEKAPKNSNGPTSRGLRDLVFAWNRNRGSLPEVRVIGADDERLLRRAYPDLLKASSESGRDPVELFGAATALFAADEFNQEKRHGIATLCRHRGKWLNLAIAPPQPNGHGAPPGYDPSEFEEIR